MRRCKTWKTSRELEKVSRIYNSKTGVGCDGFQTRRNVVEFLEEVEQRGKWPQEASRNDVLPDSEEHHE